MAISLFVVCTGDYFDLPALFMVLLTRCAAPTAHLHSHTRQVKHIT